MKSDYEKVLENTVAHALGYLSKLDETPVSATSDLTDLRRRLSKSLKEEGMDPVQVIDELVADTTGGLLGNAGGRFFGWVIGSSLPAALAADWLTSTWDQNAALYACGPAVAVIEEVCGQWLKELLSIPEDAGFSLVTGCQMAHFTCLAAARNALLQRFDWDVEKKGLFGAPQFRILCGQRHGSIERAVRQLGLGTDSVRDLPVNELGRLEKNTLAVALRESRDLPTIVLLQAGDINTGGFDSFEELIPLAQSYGAWTHVDGAFGLWAAASPQFDHLTRGIEKADSWATDGHKWLNVPYDCGYAFVTDAGAIRASMSHRASYLTHDGEARDQIDWNPEWSRRARGVTTYAAIRQLGKSGIADLVERTSRFARELAHRISALNGAELVFEGEVNQGLVRFISSKPNASEDDHDARTTEVIDKILAKSEAFFGGTVYQNKKCMRISVCSWQTSEEDVNRAVNAVKSVLEE